MRNFIDSPRHHVKKIYNGTGESNTLYRTNNTVRIYRGIALY